MKVGRPGGRVGITIPEGNSSAASRSCSRICELLYATIGRRADLGRWTWVGECGSLKFVRLPWMLMLLRAAC